MPAYSIAIPEEVVIFNGSYPLLEIKASATDFLRVLDVILNTFDDTSGTAGVVAMSLGFGLAAAVGVPLNAYRLFPEDPLSTLGEQQPGAYVSTAWSTSPTIPANFNRRLTQGSRKGLAGANGPMPIQFNFSKGFVVPFGGSAVVWVIGLSASAAVPCDATVVIDA